MAKNKLFSLFDEKLSHPGELASSPSQNLASIGSNIENTDTLLRKIQQFEIAKPKVNYSNFSNFVFFNSALDYFNITGEKILNEYPVGGSSNDLEFFLNSLDDYQQDVVNVWPKYAGHLRFNPMSGSAFIAVDDLGSESGNQKSSLLSMGSSSLSVEFWAIPPPVLTGSNDIMAVVQKVSGSGDGYSVYFSGSKAIFNVRSGSASDSISALTTPGTAQYFCFIYDRDTTGNVIKVLTGSASAFPVLVSSATGSILGLVNAGSGRLYIGSGSLSTKVVRPLTGSLDDLRIWKAARSLVDVSSSFNSRIYAQPGLAALWRFNESGSTVFGDEKTIISDHSGHKLNGRINNYFTTIRGSGSILPYDSSDLILSVNAPEVNSYVSTQQTSASYFDRYNDNALTRMMPEQFFLLEEFKNTDILKNFLFVLGRYFDQLKVRIDQFAYILSPKYGKFDQTPDALLKEIGTFFGWEFTGNFLNADVIQYILGKQVLSNTESNKHLDVKLYEIKNEFWKRTLINLMHIYKTKGTRESIETMLRVYGVNKNFIRIKEYGTKPNAKIQTYRIASEKSVAALAFGSGTAGTTNYVQSENFNGPVRTIETRLRFPTDVSVGMTASFMTGSIWALNTASDGTMKQQLYFVRENSQSATGSLIYTGSEGSLSLASIPIFNNKWYNIAVLKNYLSSSVVIDVRELDQDEIIYSATASLFTTLPSDSSSVYRVVLGSTGSLASQYWMQEARVWTEPLQNQELTDHTLNYQSFGTEEIDGLTELSLHWRLNENVSTDAGGLLYNSIFDFAGTGVSGSGAGFMTNAVVYKKFINYYNYIASPEYGWNEEKIRSLDSSVVNPEDAFVDNPLVGLEFNLTDALNEDISQILSSLDGFNESIGAPVNRYRDSYLDLDILRINYFKRLSGTINFRIFADILEFFDRTFIDMIRKLIPARATFLGDEFVVESHMLERPKMQWNYRRKDLEFQPEGVIKVFIRS